MNFYDVQIHSGVVKVFFSCAIWGLLFPGLSGDVGV